MLRKSKKVACAWVSLALEKHKRNHPFELKDILFTRAEIHQRAVSIFNLEMSDYIVVQVTDGGRESSDGTFFKTGTGDSLSMYYWLCCPEEYTGYDVDELVQGLLSSDWDNKTSYRSAEDIRTVLESYYAFVRSLVIPQQTGISGIISREAVWLATATFTYNEFQRTRSHDEKTYQFPQNMIGALAHSFNPANTNITCAQMARNSCTVGNGAQPWSYLVDMGGARRESRRRLSYYGEFEYTQPDIHEELMINTVTGVLSAKQLADFIRYEYSPVFFKQLIPPLDSTHSIEEMEQHALQMDYDSLRAAAVGRGELQPEQQRITTTNYRRDPYIARYAKERAHGICQLCQANAPFQSRRNEPYLETHHIIWLAQGGSDSVDNVVALCPNCHRKMHVVNAPRDVAYLQKLVMSGK